MRVLITRPEREATTLAAALGERGHLPVIAPLFHLQILRPSADFSASLAASQAVLLTSANGARALAEASDQRGRPIFAVGDTTASTAEGLGFSAVTSASGDGLALATLVRRKLDPKGGPLVHVSGADIALDFAEALKPDGFEVRRFALYEAREETVLPESARAAIEGRALDAATFFSPRAAELFARLAEKAGVASALGKVTAVAISPAALAPLKALPFKATVAAARPTRQAVLDEIDRLAAAGTEGPSIMSDTASSSDRPADPAPPPAEPVAAPATRQAPARRGIGVVGAFVTGIVSSCLVLAGALVSLPYWPAELRDMWRGQAALPTPTPATTPALDLQTIRQDAAAAATATVNAARGDLMARLDDLEKRLRALSTTVAERPAGAPAPVADPATAPALAELRRKVEALEGRPAAAPAPTAETAPAAPASPPPPNAEQEREIAGLKLDVATLRNALQTLDRTVSGQGDQAKVLADAVDKARSEAGARGVGEQKALAAANASAVIGIAARLNAALESGLPFAGDLGLLAPLVQGNAKLGEVVIALQPYARDGVTSRSELAAAFPTMAKAALADDVADDSFGERLLAKLRNLVSLRRVGADVEGDTTEAKLARAEAALDAGDIGKAVELVKSLPPQTAKATAAWLARAEAHLAAKRAVDQLAAEAVFLLGATR
jgi:uroporphyrinogen-III synthase